MNKKMEHRAGKWKTNLSGKFAYPSFLPQALPPKPSIEMTEEMTALLVEAHSEIAALNTMTDYIPNMGLFILMYVRKEALLSSQIEGTQATLEDVLDPRIDANANRNVEEVVNYIKATEFAIDRLNSLPLSNRLMKEIHAILMQGVRGEKKTPGEFRRSQNWIGGKGSTLQNARYIPPSPEDMKEAMSDFEKYMHTDDGADELIRAGLMHYQFETIHPFLDGNGRIGRLMITIYLMERGILKAPTLYISYFLKKNRVEYYDRMGEVRNSGDYEQWILFFLQALAECAKDAVDTIEKLVLLQEKDMALIDKMGRGALNAKRVFMYLLANPIIEIKKTAEELDIAFNTANSAVKRLEEAGILVKVDESSRNRTYEYRRYLDILKKGT